MKDIITIDRIIEKASPDQLAAALLIQLNGYVGQKTTEHLCNLSGSEIYRKQKTGTFPQKVHIGQGQRKAYRINDIQSWLEQPTTWRAEMNGAAERT